MTGSPKHRITQSLRRSVAQRKRTIVRILFVTLGESIVYTYVMF
jgi:hypothetical protein